MTGNKGEWSEIYVLFRLLGLGKLYSADENLNKIKDMFYPILRIFRNEDVNDNKEFEIIDRTNKVKIYINKKLTQELDTQTFINEARYLYEKILNGGDRTFSIPESEKFMKEIGCHKLAAPSTDKTDITMQLHDIHTGYSPVCGFSIKSELGNAPTLINASKATNFIFEVTGLSSKRIEEINSINTKNKIKDRMSIIRDEASSIEFVKCSNNQFATNLMMVDTRMCEIIAFALLSHYCNDITSCNEVIFQLEKANPLGFPAPGFYRHKFKEFLCSSALGLTPSRAWDGRDEANGGYIVVNQEGDVLAYHIYNRDCFKDYLLNNTKFERGSTTRHEYATLYTEPTGKTYLALNLQVRFIK